MLPGPRILRLLCAGVILCYPSYDSGTSQPTIAKLWRSALATDERCITVGFATTNQLDNDDLICRTDDECLNLTLAGRLKCIHRLAIYYYNTHSATAFWALDCVGPLGVHCSKSAVWYEEPGGGTSDQTLLDENIQMRYLFKPHDAWEYFSCR